MLIHLLTGNCYKIRVGGFQGLQGDGTVTITKETNRCAPNCDPSATVSQLGIPGSETVVQFGNVDIPTIPADFFLSGSDRFVGTVPLVGLPPCPGGTPPPCSPGAPPVGCPPFIVVIFPCPGGGFCLGFYAAAACCTC